MSSRGEVASGGTATTSSSSSTPPSQSGKKRFEMRLKALRSCFDFSTSFQSRAMF